MTFFRSPVTARLAAVQVRLSVPQDLMSGSLTGLVFAPLLVWACLQGTPARAHGVYIFAWAEPGKMCTDSYFGRKSKVRGGAVRMLGTSGEVLAEAVSDESGLACFAAPEAGPDGPGDLLFVVLAGQGHRAEFVLPAALAAQAYPATEPPGDPAPDTGAPGRQPAGDPAAGDQAIRGPATGDQGAASAPAARPEPAASAPAAPEHGYEGPGVRDIVGGLGWIVGLAGLGAWWSSRKRRG